MNSLVVFSKTNDDGSILFLDKYNNKVSYYLQHEYNKCTCYLSQKMLIQC